ncbi:DUF3293 domain-containing protein [Idiomarina aminovorans]|uniref:DUF3293 domain-containing protein n=1 Tax=Idiomarina aminovorans TaxID=2914829 RepID=UPI0020050229|nr:DUF3293 domain-containing protein [Idiomarina sp. ATCH4]MCK7459996.1 DUF3293 domain-containing protein [Idiomarina sp. ATCH4]
MDKELLTHYKNTDYWFMVDQKKITLCIGQKNNHFDRLCEHLSCTTGAFITACNPQSELLTRKENKSRNAQLATRLEQLDRIYCFLGEGQDRAKQWPAEQSYMVFGLKQQTAIDLAREYQQNALVWIEYQQVAALIEV